jgi:hypothetical protein
MPSGDSTNSDSLFLVIRSPWSVVDDEPTPTGGSSPNELEQKAEALWITLRRARGLVVRSPPTRNRRPARAVLQ